MIKLINDDKGNPIGWEMCPSTKEEHEIAGTIRDLQFFGLGETYPAYNGLQLIEPEKGKVMGNIKRISWIQRKHQKS